jgi:two-component system, cell cycle sensor histidine kinase and response regulator CckA
MGSELSTGTRASMVVLLADDELVVRSLARSVLTRAGYKVLDAVDGEQALEVSRQYTGPIDLLLTDVKMPKMDGLQLSAQISRERPGIKILLMSGRPSGELIVRGEKMPFLRKPFLPDVLCERLNSLLARE